MNIFVIDRNVYKKSFEETKQKTLIWTQISNLEA